MWRPRPLFVLFLMLLAAFLAVGSLTGGSSSQRPGNSASSCHADYRPVGLSTASCSIPSGGTFDPCGIVTLGVTHCPVTLPDFNPADWFGWFACSVAADASDIWNAIVGDVGSFFVTVAQDLVQAFAFAVQTVVNAVTGLFASAVGDFGTLLTGFFSAVDGAAQPLGPFAPILVVTLTLAIFLVGGIGLYFAIILMFAFGKTVFNLL